MSASRDQRRNDELWRSGELLSLWEDARGGAGTADAVFHTLREALLSRLLPARLRTTEHEISVALDVSRTPVREALLRLEEQGLIERRERAVIVNEISAAEIESIYRVRTELDGLAAELAVDKITPPQIAQLRYLNERMIEQAEEGNFAAGAQLNIEWHDTMTAISENAFLASVMGQVTDRVRRFGHSTFEYPGRWQEVAEEHTSIVDALEARDAEAARARARTHVERTRDLRVMLNRERA